MNIVKNWEMIVKKAWSMRLAVLAALFATLEVSLPFFTDIVPPRTMAALAAVAAFGSAISRIILQPELHK